jgi:hypothetical protein
MLVPHLCAAQCLRFVGCTNLKHDTATFCWTDLKHDRSVLCNEIDCAKPFVLNPSTGSNFIGVNLLAPNNICSMAQRKQTKGCSRGANHWGQARYFTFFLEGIMDVRHDISALNSFVHFKYLLLTHFNSSIHSQRSDGVRMSSSFKQLAHWV